MSNAIVAGVDMVKFAKPGQQEPYRVMASTAIQGALKDAGIEASAVQQAYGSYIYGDSTCAQHALYDAFMTGIPVINVNNNCSSGSTALFLARQAVESGAAECVLAFGFEEMQPGALSSHWDDRESPFDNFLDVLDKADYPAAPLALRCFGAAGHYYMEKYNASRDIFAKVSVKTRNHALNNPLSLFNTPLTEEQVLNDKVVFMDYLTRTMCCPPTCGAGAAIVCSEAFAKKHGIDGGVKIAAQAMATDTPQTWDNPIDLIGADMTRRAAKQVFEEASVDVSDVDVVELHDCFTTNEVVTYEGLGLCAEGEASKFIADGDNTYGGKFVVNPSGGLMSKGHPIGATGLAQCYELVNQLRGQADQRQVAGAKLALQHNLGLGGAVVVTLYQAS
ncbi:lipid-transfer protein [Pseudoteredinibacter isoporae]|uniref:propanoyl-CoA C-acyltransferase n=1 Tax=Pseudoteredinibacter isoporae TaxID=570281 RepID=A0A7X0MWH3_9GAMM|nr:lipid-transfer protein [Pseudoteredinibacter isoporae]MBB6520939.1 acetyl-CoA acetyltransferase [Pseudoteredinibacter isoporae]NHO86504.1 lipid-transfer protein [Pseudoteredinibacter isoporae]NIB25044.1 lipid-transfer protein [Pseudoteredinibacter isoporae]